MLRARNKYQHAVNALRPDVATLLDVGCRDGKLRSYLPSSIRYVGVDLFPGDAVTKVCNIEQGLPYEEASFDAVVALDVLEHTENIWFAFEEIARVSRRQIIVVLPNIYHWFLRLRFLLGLEMDKYRLSPTLVQDRHRWLTSYDSARLFCYSMAQRHGLIVSEVLLSQGRKTADFLDPLIGFFSPNLGTWATMFVFSKDPR